MSASKKLALAEPLQMGNLVLKNRIVMASMTRNRATYTIPNAEVAKYYAQRSGAGLILSEGAMISLNGSDSPNAPGIWTKKQIEGWKLVTDSVHTHNSLIFAQLWHLGRTAHPLLQGGQPVLSPSGIPAQGGKFRTLEGQPGYVSNPIAIEDPWEVIELYRNAARNAMKANFDGVELHAANGYLPNQFIEAHSNQRSDEWGGSPEKRAKFVLEAIKAMIEETGDSKKVGIKLTPCGGFNDMGDPEDVLTEEYTYLIKELDKLNLGYIQLCRHLPAFDPIGRGTVVDLYAKFGHLIKNSLFFGGGNYTMEEAEEHVANKTIGAVVIGRPFVNNPDLPERVFNGLPLDQNIDWVRMYNPAEGEDIGEGYTTYQPFSSKLSMT